MRPQRPSGRNSRKAYPRSPPSRVPAPPIQLPPAVYPRPNRFPVSPETRAFRRRFFPGVSDAEWSDWRWQLRRRIRDLVSLEQVFTLSEDERAAVGRHQGPLPVGITPYYASRMDPADPADPLRRTHLPVGDECLRSPGEADDPLGEDGHTAVPGLVHRYPDRVLFLVSSTCSTYCRYCTRSRMVGDSGDYEFGNGQWERAIDYIGNHPEIRNVLLSGGDPLTLADDKLDWLLGRLRSIPHLEVVRIGTKVPVVMPMRITPRARPHAA